MNRNKFIVKIQNFTGATTAELTVALLIFGGFFCGFIIKHYFEDEISTHDKGVSYFHILDSLAEAEKSTFTGTDLYGNEIAELTTKDTIVQKVSVFPNVQKKSEPVGIINLNTATKLQLMKLPGVGEKTAIKIIEYRNKKNFDSIEEIQKIHGIGIKKFDNMKNYLQV